MMGLKFLAFVSFISVVRGHGNMVRPMAWWDANQSGWYWDAGVADNGVGCGVLDLPDSEFVEVTGNPPDCMKMWFTSQTEIPGERTLPEEMSQPEVKCVPPLGDDDPDKMKKHPWNAPGTGNHFNRIIAGFKRLNILCRNLSSTLKPKSSSITTQHPCSDLAGRWE